MLPAGEYRFDLDFDHMLVRVRDERGTAVWLLRLTPGGGRRPLANLDTALLRFEQYGNRYVLNGIWGAGRVEGIAVTPSRIPRELAKTKVVRDRSATR